MDEPEQIPDAMKKRQRRIIIGICLFFTAVFVAGVHQRLHGILLLRGMLAELDKTGEEMDYRKFPIRVPESTNNMVPQLLALSYKLNAIEDVLPEAPPIRFVAKIRLPVLFQQKEWEDTTSSIGLISTNSWDKFISRIAPVLELAEDIKGAIDGMDFHTGYLADQGFHDLPMGGYFVARDAYRTLLAAYLVRMKQGDHPQAIENLSACESMIAAMRNEPLIINEMFRQSAAQDLFFATWHGLQVTGWTDTQLEKRQHFWQRQRFHGALLICLRFERAQNLERHRRLERSSGTPSQQHREWKETSAPHGMGASLLDEPINRYLTVPMWHLIWKEQDCFRNLERWNTLVADLSWSMHHGWAPKRAAPNPPAKWIDQYRYLFSNEEPMWLDRRQATVRQLGMEALRNMTIGAIAIHRHILKHGKPPGSLENLAPNYLRDIPLDPFDRKPLRYRVDGDEWVLYSVGENIDDDGGEVEIGAPGKPVESIFDGADIVWPRPALPNQTEEIQNN